MRIFAIFGPSWLKFRRIISATNNLPFYVSRIDATDLRRGSAVARGRKWTFTFSEKNNERQNGSYCGNVFTVCGFHGPRGCATYDEGWSGRTTRVLWNERPSLYVHAPLCTGCTVQTNSIYRQPACLPGCNFVELSATSTTFSRETFSLGHYILVQRLTIVWIGVIHREVLTRYPADKRT